MLNWLIGNLDGALGQRWFMAVVLTLFAGLISIITIIQIQKDNLREDIVEITAQLSKQQSEHIAEIQRITVKNNQIIKDMVSQEDVARLKAELSRQKVKARVELIINKQLNKKLKKLESIDLEKCELPEEVKIILNGEK